MVAGRQRDKIYISGSLNTVRDRKNTFKFYDFLAKVCGECGLGAYLPHKKSDPETVAELSPAAVFAMDFDKMAECKRILAAIGQPSSGMGAEIGIALERGMEVVAVYRHGENPSRFVLGLLEHHHSTMICYSDYDDCRKQLVQYFST